MKKKDKSRMILLAVIAAVVILLIVGGVVLAKSLKGVKSLTITPEFTEQELDVNQDYNISISADPANAKLSSLEYVIDNSAATFQSSDANANQAILHTTAEGTITISVKNKKIESNTLSFTIVDQAAKAAQEQADAEAAQAEADALAAAESVSENETISENATELVMTTDTVKIRSTPSTDGEALDICKKYDTFNRYDETEDGWSRIDYNGTDAYIKSDYLVVTTEEEAAKAKEEAKAEEEKAAKEKEEQAQADAEKKQAEDAANAAAQAAAAAASTSVSTDTAQAAATTATPAAATTPAVTSGTVSYTDKNGATTTFTTEEWNYINSYWAYTGQAEYFVHKHTCAELHALYNATH